jgi:hypothetical protein
MDLARVHADVGAVEVAAIRGKENDSTHNSRELVGRDNSAGDVIHVAWEFWRVTQSEFRYRESGVIDLGEI